MILIRCFLSNIDSSPAYSPIVIIPFDIWPDQDKNQLLDHHEAATSCSVKTRIDAKFGGNCTSQFKKKKKRFGLIKSRFLEECWSVSSQELNLLQNAKSPNVEDTSHGAIEGLANQSWSVFNNTNATSKPCSMCSWSPRTVER